MSKLTHVPVPEDSALARPTSPDPEREARLAVLERYLTDHRRRRIEHALVSRIGSVAMVVDGVYDLGNASAIMRTCDGMGVHRVYYVETVEQYKPAHRTAQGSNKWLSLRRFDDPLSCAEAVRADGYALYGAALEGSTHTLETLDVSRPVAIVLGSEHDGLSRPMMDACDALFRIDMRGLSQSYNVSVAAAISLYSVLTRRAALAGPGAPVMPPGDLSPAVTDALREEWYRKAVKNSEVILERELGVAPPPIEEIEGPLGELR